MVRKHRNYRLIAAALLLCLIFSGPKAPAVAQSQGPQDMDELGGFLDGLMAATMSANHVPGAVVVVVRDGALVFSRGYGYADREKRTPVDPARTLFRPGSVSKLFTWTAVMQLVEQGKLSLNADVNVYLDFQIPEAFGKPITLADLLTHTPGFEDRGEGLFVLSAEELVSLETYLKNNLPARVFPPGTVGAYSNYGAALAGYIVERVSGMPFADYIEQKLFAPLGMTQATFVQPLPERLSGDMAGGYNYAGGQYYRGGFEYISGTPAGGLSASGLELGKFMIAHLQNGRSGDQRILKEETALLMHSNLRTADQRQEAMGYGFFTRTTNGQRVILHTGDTMLFHSGLFLLPEQNLGLYLSTNGASGGQVVDSVYQNFMDHYYPAANPATPAPAADAEQRAALYSGEYYLARSNTTTLEKFIRLFNPVSIRSAGGGRYFISLFGETKEYVETEPGLLVSSQDPDQRIVVKENLGQVMLLPAIPMDVIKTPWYASGGLALLILGGGALLFLLALLRWFLGFFGWLFHRRRGELAHNPLFGRVAHWVGGIFGLLFLGLIFTLGAVFLDVNPAYGVPDFFFSVPEWFKTMINAQMLLIPLAGAMLLLAALAWVQRFWNARGRLFYTLLSLWAAAVVWAMVFWKMIMV